MKNKIKLFLVALFLLGFLSVPPCSGSGVDLSLSIRVMYELSFEAEPGYVYELIYTYDLDTQEWYYEREFTVKKARTVRIIYNTKKGEPQKYFRIRRYER